MSHIYTEITTLVTETCCNCAVLFAMPYELRERLLHDHSQSFYCPNGHSQHYSGATDAEKERKLREEAERKLASAAEDARVTRIDLASTRGQLTKARRKIDRIDKGTCPHCRRHFVNVERHMATKHHEVTP